MKTGERTSSEVDRRHSCLPEREPAQADQALDRLAVEGITLGMPHISYLSENLWELRFRCGQVNQRITYIANPDRQSVALTTFSKQRHGVDRARKALRRHQNKKVGTAVTVKTVTAKEPPAAKKKAAKEIADAKKAPAPPHRRHRRTTRVADPPRHATEHPVVRMKCVAHAEDGLGAAQGECEVAALPSSPRLTKCGSSVKRTCGARFTTAEAGRVQK